MVKLYLMKIHQGKMTIDDVPEFWRDKVALELAKEAKEGE